MNRREEMRKGFQTEFHINPESRYSISRHDGDGIGLPEIAHIGYFTTKAFAQTVAEALVRATPGSKAVQNKISLDDPAGALRDLAEGLPLDLRDGVAVLLLHDDQVQVVALGGTGKISDPQALLARAITLLRQKGIYPT